MIKIGQEVFEIRVIKGRKVVFLPWEKLSPLKDRIGNETTLYKGLRGTVVLNDKYTLLAGEKLSLILSLISSLNIDGAPEKSWPRKEHFNSREDLSRLLGFLPDILHPAIWKPGKKELGFLCLLCDGKGNYWFTCSRGFHTSLNESLASVESLIDELGEETDIEIKRVVNQTYRRLSDYLG
jgi:hypothetical protein